MKAMFGFSPTLVFADPKSVEFVLSSNTILKKSYDYKFFHSWLGTGLLTSLGAKWKNHRRLLTPAFHFQILEKFIEVFNSQSNVLIKKLEDMKSKEFDIFPLLKLHTLDIICEATMNTSINAQMNPDSNYVNSVKEICRIATERSFSYKMWDVIYYFTDDYKQKRKRGELQAQIASGVTTTNDLGTKKKIPFLDLLLTSTVEGKPLTNEEIRNEVDTFMFAGHDTTTSAISFTLYALSKHQEIQDKVFEEVIDVLGAEEPDEISYENLQKLKYLEQVVKEVLRFYSPITNIARVLTEDVIYEGNVIPKGTIIQVAIYHLHHNPELFPKPEVFDPERFNPENSKVYLFIPLFRLVLGLEIALVCQKFAMLEIKATVCKILQKIKLLPAVGHEPILVVDVVTTSENGLPLRCEQRNYK
ncbi:hypothetical protein FQR65_LT03768 [Abscondita terminalis]|nr:hypothetical protein FQR65_LT03768 [Abscondita terminalis]